MSTLESSVGSYNDYVAAHPELGTGEAVKAYFAELGAHRERLASSLGITAAELHEKGTAAYAQQTESNLDGHIS